MKKHGNIGNRNAASDNPKTTGFSGRCYSHEKGRWVHIQQEYGFRNFNEFAITAMNKFCDDIEKAEAENK